MGRMERTVGDAGHQLSAEQHDEQGTAKLGKVPDRVKSGHHNSASSALDEDIAREITKSPAPIPEKPIVSINGRDVDPCELDKAA